MATIRIVIFDDDQKGERGKCVLCGDQSKQQVLFAKAY
jgi:hypothetical protein